MCLGFHSLPPLPALSDRARSYNATLNEWKLLRARGREAARTVEFGWRLGGSNGEQLTTAERVKAEFAGVVFVGDSQVREASWAALGLLLRGRELRYFERDPVFAEWRSWIRSGPKRAINGSVVRSACMPEQIRLGFSVSCGAPHGGGCRIHSPFGSAKEMGNAYKVLEAGDPVRGPGLFELACESDFFVTYQAVWGSAPINLDGLPACLRKRRLGWASAPAALPAPRRLEAQPPRSRPPRQVVNGGGLHEMRRCSDNMWRLPHVRGAAQPAGGGAAASEGGPAPRTGDDRGAAGGAPGPRRGVADGRRGLRAALSQALGQLRVGQAARGGGGEPALARLAWRAARGLHVARRGLCAADERQQALYALHRALRQALPRAAAARRAARAAGTDGAPRRPLPGRRAAAPAAPRKQQRGKRVARAPEGVHAPAGRLLQLLRRKAVPRRTRRRREGGEDREEEHAARGGVTQAGRVVSGGREAMTVR